MARLDGLRGILAVYVMLGHALPFTCLPAWLTRPFSHGEAAVDLFFTLSGMVVVNALENISYRFGPFMRGRARRLLPVYLTVLAMGVATVFAGSPVPLMPWVAPRMAAMFWTIGVPAHFQGDLLAHLFLAQGLVPQGMLPYAYVSLLGPAWSLSTEFQFYIVMALVLARWRNFGGFALGLLSAGVVWRLGAPLLGPYWQFSRAFLPDAAPYFALGLASTIWVRGGGTKILILAAAVCYLLGLAADEKLRALIPLGWMLALAAQVYPGRFPAVARLLDSRPAQFLGVISYPLYLLNEPVQRALAILIAPLAHGDAHLFTAFWLPGAVFGSIAAAAVLHVTLELPFMRATPRNRSAGPLRSP
jgi:peptidoglycan/LPS O-acetylase OafA/YrhL